MKKIDAMNEAFNKKDKTAFYNYLEVPKNPIANADQFYAVVQDINLCDLRAELVYKIDKIKEKQPTDTIRYSGNFLYLDKKPILFGLYNEVIFNLIPTEVSVQLPFKSMTITIAEQTIQSEVDEEIIQVGDFIPGIYEWTYELEKNYIKLSDKGNVHIYQDEYN